VKFHIYIFVSFRLWVFGHPEVRWYLSWTSSFKLMPETRNNIQWNFTMPNPEPWVPGAESQNPKPRSCDLYNLIIELPSPETWNSSAKCQTLNPEPRVLGAESRNSELGTRGLGFGTWHLGQKFDVHIFDRYLCPVSSPEFRVPGVRTWDSAPGTWHLGFGTWHVGTKIWFTHFW
jgi:hypothetical protein